MLALQGKFTAAQKKELFQLVARNNTVSTDVVSKLGILERSEAAWKDKDYNFVWEGEGDLEYVLCCVFSVEASYCRVALTVQGRRGKIPFDISVTKRRGDTATLTCSASKSSEKLLSPMSLFLLLLLFCMGVAATSCGRVRSAR